MRFFNNFFSMLKGPSFSCGLVCWAAHFNSRGSNRNRIVLFRLGRLKRSIDQTSASSTLTKLLRALSSRVLKTSRNGECTTYLYSLWQFLIFVTVKFFPLKSEPPHMTIASHPAPVHLRREFCSIFLITSGTGRKFLCSPSSLWTERSSLILSSQGMCSHPLTILIALRCTDCNLSTHTGGPKVWCGFPDVI